MNGSHATWGGAWMAVKTRSHSGCQGQATGMRSRIFLAFVAMRAGTWMSLRRTVPVRALVTGLPRLVSASAVPVTRRLSPGQSVGGDINAGGTPTSEPPSWVRRS